MYNKIIENSEEKLEEALHENTLNEVLRSINKMEIIVSILNYVTGNDYSYLLEKERSIGGTRLVPKYILHHADHNHENNVLDNLYILNRNDHQKYHHGLISWDEIEKINISNILNDFLKDKSSDVIESIKTSILAEDINTAKSIIADQVRGEWEAIRNYQKAVDDLKDLGNFDDVINILNSISDEEEVHVGELEKAQSLIDNNLLDNIEDGRNEAEEDLAGKEAPVDESLKESSLNHDSFETENYYLEYRYNKNNGYEVIGGDKLSDGLVSDDFHKYFATEEAAKKYFEKCKKKISAGETLNEEIHTKQLDEIESFINDIYELRKEGLITEGEYGIKNLTFKSLRSRGYLDNLKDLRNQLIGKELSLESLEQTVPQDLSDNRQPRENEEPEILEEPYSYKDMVAKEQCLTEAPDIFGIETDSEIDREADIRKLAAHNKRKSIIDGDILTELHNNRLADDVAEARTVADKKQAIIKFIKQEIPIIRKGSNSKGRSNWAYSDEYKDKPLDDLMIEKFADYYIDYWKNNDRITKYRIYNKDMSWTSRPIVEKLSERFDLKQIYQYKQELSKIAHNQAIVQENRLFNIYNVKEDDLAGIMSRIRNLSYIEWVQSNAGRYDFSHPQFMGPQKRYYNIVGKIKEEI